MVLADSTLGKSAGDRSSCNRDHLVAFCVAIADPWPRRQSLCWDRGLPHTSGGFLCGIGAGPNWNLSQ